MNHGALDVPKDITPSTVLVDLANPRSGLMGNIRSATRAWAALSGGFAQ